MQKSGLPQIDKQTDKDDGSCFATIMEQRVGKMQNEAPRVQLFLAEGRHHSQYPTRTSVEIEDVSAFGGKADTKILAGRYWKVAAAPVLCFKRRPILMGVGSSLARAMARS